MEKVSMKASSSHILRSFHRSTRFTRFSRYSSRIAPRSEEFQIRRSLADVVIAELDAQNKQYFYQRVTLLAKNATIMKPRAPTVVVDVPEEVGQSENVDSVPAEAKAEDLKEDFKRYVDERLRSLIVAADQECFIADNLNGVFVCMGDYTLLVLEGIEEIMGIFLNELCKEEKTFWQTIRVFLVEDKITEYFFSGFHSRRSHAININEKFPTATPNDTELMGEQHRKLKERLHTLYEALSGILIPPKKESEISIIEEEYLPGEEFNKLLPEVQRIELVLNSRFYRDLDIYAITYKKVPLWPDEDLSLWPIPFSYIPVAAFDRTPFDVNLTFAEEEKKKEEMERKEKEAQVEKDDREEPEEQEEQEVKEGEEKSPE